jgi:WD40 repeat protein
MSRIDLAVRELVEAFVNGEATAEQCADLETRLAASESARDYYLSYLNLHSALRRRFLLPEDPASSGEATAEVVESPAASTTDRSWAGAGLAVLVGGTLLAGWLALVYWPGSPAGDDRSATVRVVEGEVVRFSSSGQAAAKTGDLLRPGETLRVEGEDARAAIEYADGTLIRIQSGSVVRSPVEREVRLDLLAGAMEVEAVRPMQEASIFATEHSRYVAKDTRFRLYHDEAASRIEIEQGKVRVERPSRGESVEVEAGSMAIAAGETPVEVRPMAFGSSQLAQTLKDGGQKVAFAADDSTLVTSNWETGLKLWTFGKTKPAFEYRRDPEFAEPLVLAGEKSPVMAVTRGGKVVAWQPGEKTAVSLALPGRQTRSRCLSPDGMVVAESGEQGTKVYDIDLAGRSLRERRSFPGPGKTWCLALSKNGDLLAAGYWDGTIRVLDTRSGELRWERRLAHTPTHLDLTRDGGRLVVFTQRDGIKQIDLTAGEQRTLWEPGAGTVRCLRFDPAGQYVLAGLNDRTARMWSVEDGRQLLVIDAGHAPQGIAWSEKEQVLVTADGAVKVWKCDLMQETIQ